ncbi:MAG: M56 family metallopeptidase, partial [Mariniblastus sp.]|nr:M56 family metallopeptidase [Mariniblastus sp.]
MIDFILQMTVSNLLVALVLVILALVLQRRYRANALANVVWVLILLKLLTPPLVSLPLVELESLVESAPSTLTRSVVAEKGGFTDVVISAAELDSQDATRVELGFVDNGSSIFSQVIVALGLVWIGVSALLLSVSLFRIIRFHIQIHRQSKAVEPWVQRSGHEVAATLGLVKTPQISVLPANISPFVWWLGGRPQIFLSQVAMEQLQPSELRLVLAHEMVHIKRFDHCVRWLEWLAAAALWWNPVMWVARKQLRLTEEMACDAAVVQMTGVAKYDYASSLLNMAEILAKSTNRPPTVASEFNSGGDLEKRLKMIISNKQLNISQGMRMLTIALAVCIFPVGLVYAQDYGAVQSRLVEAVKAGELSREQVAPMMEALKKNAKPKVVGSKEEANQERYNAGAKRIEAAIKSGKISKVEGKNRLAEMRKQMSPARNKGDAKSDRAEGGDMEVRKRRYKASAEEIEMAVEAGKMSKQEAGKTLIEMRKEMFPARRKSDAKSDRAEGGDMEVRKRRYKASAEEIEMAVEAGKMSKGDAERKLIEMRKKMFPSRSKGDAKSDRAEGGDMEVRKRRY